MSDVVKVIGLKAENIKRLKAVDVVFGETGVTIVGGRNEQGKSSLLDALFMTLAGGKAVPSKPIRDGESKGHTEVKLDNGLRVSLHLTASGKRIVVENSDGAEYKSPQRMLDALLGDYTFDPLAFTRLKGAKQAEMLKAVVGVDTAELDEQYADIFEQRKEANRKARDEEGRLRSMPEGEDVERVDVSAVARELTAANETERAMGAASAAVNNAQHAIDHAKASLDSIPSLDDALEALRAEYKEKAARITENHQRMRDEQTIGVNTATDNLEAAKTAWQTAAAAQVNPAPIQAKLDGAEATNRKADEYAAAQRQSGSVEAAKGAADVLDTQLHRVDSDRRALLESADFPVEGLSFSSEGVTLNGIPFEQCSSAEQLGVAVEMGFAANAKLKLLMIRDGSLLDADHLDLIKGIAAKHGGQIIMERVGDGDEGAIIIEDGEVKG